MVRGRSDTAEVAGFREQRSKEGFKISGWLCSMEVVCDLPYDRLCETGSRVSFWTKYSTPEQNSPFSAIRDGLVFISGVESSSNPIIRGF